MDKFVALAKKMLTKNGFSITLETRGEKVFDIDEGEYVYKLTETEGLGVFLSFKTEELLLKTSGLTDFLLNSVDSILLVYFEDWNWNTNSYIKIDDSKYEILAFSDVKSKKETACRKLILKKVK